MVADFFLGHFNKITGVDILELVIPPIDNDCSGMCNQHPLAVHGNPTTLHTGLLVGNGKVKQPI